MLCSTQNLTRDVGLLQTYTGHGMKAKDANQLPGLLAEGQAKKVQLGTPIIVEGTVCLM